MNDIGRTTRASQPIFWDSYRRNRITGSFILVDPFSNETWQYDKVSNPFTVTEMHLPSG